MVTQLRIYTINRGRMDDFVRAWHDGVYPLRLRLGFHITSAWVCKETNQFVWVLGYAGPEAWEDVDRAYYESPERAAMDPDPARFIARAEYYFVTPAMPQP